MNIYVKHQLKVHFDSKFVWAFNPFLQPKKQFPNLYSVVLINNNKEEKEKVDFQINRN